MLIGFIQVPTEPFTHPAHVWDTEQRRWQPFPNPLLTPPSEFLANYDWLPAILESFLLAIAQSHQPPVMSSLRPYIALRRIYDDSPADPVAGLQTLAAKTHLVDFLRSGSTNTGIASVVEGTGPETDIDERAQLLKNYFQEFHTFTGHHYLAPGEGGGPGVPGATGGGSFSVIAARAQASTTPIFRDIAPDVFWATQRLIGIVDDCAAAAHQPVKPSTVPPRPPTGVPGNVYEVPQGGEF